ncbi:MAG: hypothetical protein R3B13_11170 [Polyangiaceae bacterium]
MRQLPQDSEQVVELIEDWREGWFVPVADPVPVTLPLAQSR